MGAIRGRHVSPGIYTKITALGTKQTPITKTAPMSTKNSFVEGGSGGILSNSYYFGYLPIETKNGKETTDNLNYLRSLTIEDIENISTIKKIESLSSTIKLTNDKEMVIKPTISKSELNNRVLVNHEEYNVIADENNNCVILIIPSSKSKYYITDTYLNDFKLNCFSVINKIKKNKTEYNVLCMFNDKYAYSSIGMDKVISPITLHIG